MASLCLQREHGMSQGIIVGGCSQILLADLVVLAEQAGKAAMGKKNGARTAAAGQDRLFAEVGQRFAHHRLCACPAESFPADEPVYAAGPRAEGAIRCYGFQGMYSLIQPATRSIHFAPASSVG